MTTHSAGPATEAGEWSSVPSVVPERQHGGIAVPTCSELELPRSQSAAPRGGCQGWYCQRTNAQLYVLLTRGVTDGPVSVQARETGAHSCCSQSIPPLWGELQAGLGGLEPAIAVCLGWPTAASASRSPALGGRKAGKWPCCPGPSQRPAQREAWTAHRLQMVSVDSQPPTCPSLSLLSCGPCSAPKPPNLELQGAPDP